MKVVYKSFDAYNLCEELKIKLENYKRKEKITWTKLSIMCDVTTRELRMIRKGERNPKFEIIVRIAQALNLTLDELCDFVYEN